MLYAADTSEAGGDVAGEDEKEEAKKGIYISSNNSFAMFNTYFLFQKAEKPRARRGPRRRAVCPVSTSTFSLLSLSVFKYDFRFRGGPTQEKGKGEERREGEGEGWTFK